MDTVTTLLSLIKEEWLLFYYPSSQTMNYFKQTEPRLRINPNRVAAIESHTESMGKAYHSLYALSQEANLIRDAVCESKALAVPKSEIAPELHDLIKNSRFDGVSLLLACTTQGWINIAYAGDDHYLVTCDISIARGIPYIFNQVATMLQAMRKALKQSKAFEMTCTLFASSQTPSCVPTVPGAQTHHTKFTVQPNTSLTTRTFKSLDNSKQTSQPAHQPSVPTSVKTESMAPAPRNSTQSDSAVPRQPDAQQASPQLKAQPAAQPPKEATASCARSEYSFEEVLQERILAQLRTADKGLSVVALQNQLSRFFRQEIEDCLNQLTEEGSIEKSDSIHYMTVETLEKQRANQKAEPERMAPPATKATDQTTEDAPLAKQQPTQAHQELSTKTLAPSTDDSEADEQTNWRKVLKLIGEKNSYIKVLLEHTHVTKDDGSLLVITFPANERRTKKIALQRRVANVIKKSVGEVFGSRAVALTCEGESTANAQFFALAPNDNTPTENLRPETASQNSAHAASPATAAARESSRPAASEPPAGSAKQPSANPLEPFRFNTIEGAALFLRSIGMDRLPICNVLDIPASKYLDFLEKGYEIVNHPEQHDEKAREDARIARKAQNLKRSEMRLLIQYFTGKIAYEQGSIHSRDCYQNNEALDRIFDRFDLFTDSPAATEAPHIAAGQPIKNDASENAPLTIALARATIAKHPYYPTAPKGTSACEGAGTALPLDYWPYPFAQIEHRVLFLHLLGANRAEMRTALGIPLQRIDDLMEAACKHTPVVRGAAFKTARGRMRVNPELVNHTIARAQGDPMEFAICLPARCKAYMVGWLLGEHNLQIADRAEVGVPTLEKLQKSILDELQHWNETRAVETAETPRKDTASESAGRKPAQKPMASAASKPAYSPSPRSAITIPEKQHRIFPGHLIPKPTPFPPLPEYPVAIGQQLSEPLRGQVLPLEYWPYPFLKEEDRALFLRLLDANISEISKSLGISKNEATSMVKEGCRQHQKINQATTFHSWGGVTIDASRIDIKELRAKADPMGFPCTLMRDQRAFLLQWLMGADDIQLAKTAGIAIHQVLAYHKAINEAQRSWIHPSSKPSGHNAAKQNREPISAQMPAACPKQAPIKPEASSRPAPQAPVQEPLPFPKNPPTFDEWVQTLDDFTSKIIIAKIEDNGFASVAGKTGTSIRQCRLAYMEARAHQPRLQEDEYLHLVETYNITKERFIQLTGLSGRSYLYLCRLRSQKGVRPLIPNGLNDPNLPAGFRNRLEKSNQRQSKNNSVLIDGIAVPRRFEALITRLGKRLTSQKPITVAQFQIEYQQLLEKNGLERQPLLAAANNPQTFSQEIARTNRFLIPSQKHVRYYDFDAHDFTPVAAMLRKESSRDIECSAQILFDTHRALMDQLDLKTEDELFVIIKRVVSEYRIQNVTILKNPMLRLGKANRHQQVLEIIQELSPANADEIASSYQERYGVSANTVKSSYLRDFQAYRKHGIYEYRDTSLTDTQRDYLANLLTDDCHVLSSVKMRYEAAPFSPSGLDINGENLESLGYITSHGLVVRKDIDLKALFAERIDSHERFCEGDSGFEEAVMHHPAFRSELSSRISLYQIVQFEPGKYISSKKLEDIFGISPSMLSAYARKVARSATPEVPFTVESLRRSGFSDPVDSLREDADFKDCFYETLIESLPATDLIKRTSLDGTKVYCRSKTPLSSSTFIKHIVQREREIEIEDLLYLLEDEYGIKTTINVLRGIIERAYQANYIFYNQQFETLLPDKAANAEFLRRCINGNK